MKEFYERLIKIYQSKISPHLNKKGIKCRYYPSCSEYSRIAVKKYGLAKGMIKTINRLGRCNFDNYDSCIDFP